MEDSQCVAFLQWALPRLGMRWAGFRKVRRQICKRLVRIALEQRAVRIEVGQAELDAYLSLIHI